MELQRLNGSSGKSFDQALVLWYLFSFKISGISLLVISSIEVFTVAPNEVPVHMKFLVASGSTLLLTISLSLIRYRIENNERSGTK